MIFFKHTKCKYSHFLVDIFILTNFKQLNNLQECTQNLKKYSFVHVVGYRVPGSLDDLVRIKRKS